MSVAIHGMICTVVSGPNAQTVEPASDHRQRRELRSDPAGRHREHGELSIRDDRWVVRDLHSTNGTRSAAERFAARFHAPTTPVALAGLRAGWAPTPLLDPDPAELTRRRARLLEVAESRVKGFGLSVAVRETPGSDNALFEREPSLQVVVLRDDIDGAADETAAARQLEEELAGEAFDALRPFTVHGEYCK